MLDLLQKIASKFWPGLEGISDQRRLAGIADVITVLINFPLGIAGLAWLVARSNLQVFIDNWVFLSLFLGLIYLFNQVSYFFIVEIRKDRYGSADGSLASMLQWSAVFLFGPTALWLTILNTILNHILTWRRNPGPAGRWSVQRSLSLELSGNTIAYLGALAVYEGLGGVYPLSTLSVNTLLIALISLFAHFVFGLVLWSSYIGFSIYIQKILAPGDSAWRIVRFLTLVLGLPVLAHPFAILLTGLYQQNGLDIFLFLVAGMLLVAYLARQLSWAAETSRQHSRQLEKLEHLGRDIISTPPDGSRLEELLREHVPPMFPSGRIVIWLQPDILYLVHPADWNPNIQPIWEFVQQNQQANTYLANEQLPWQGVGSYHDPVVLAPIHNDENTAIIGCTYIELRSLAQPWDRKALHSLLPAIQSLAAQVASALQRAKVYAESLDYHKMLQELEFAGRIQASFLPRELPSMDGWELAVTLLPARETSGDYFDIIPISDGKIGILIADVADKGLGAALYMALSRTLIRTFALEYGVAPEIVFYSVNERILQDASANLFVTAFYGILDQSTGTLTYVNAGHNPPFLLSSKNGNSITALTQTGMPIGIDEDAVWTQNAIQIDPGDTLVLYTDGIPDSQNSEGSFFRERRLIEVAQANRGQSAQELQKAILDSVEQFVGRAAQFDDITLLVIQRDIGQSSDTSSEA